MVDYSKFLSVQSKNRKPSPIRELLPLARKEGMISLGAGNPNPDTFPYAGMKLMLKTGETIEVDPALFQRCLNYDLTSGLDDLNKWLRNLQINEHQLNDRNFRLTIGSGSQDIITKALQMVIDPGSSILVEDPTYTGVLSFLRTQPCHVVGVDVDQYGLIPEALERTLLNWPKEKEFPRIIYTVPTGGNPTGASATKERKEKIYAICQTYDLLIFEDDPYYYLQFGDRICSYLSMDRDGRVLRFDSLSKILSSGFRLGWVTGPEELVHRIDLHSMSTNLQPSGISQLVAYELLQKWGLDGFYQHVKSVAQFYESKCKEFAECLEIHMKSCAEWTVPDAGMFVWIKLLGVTDSFDLIKRRAVDKKVLAVPGIAFIPSEEKTPFVRLSYSNVSKEQMNEALRRLAEAVHDEVTATSQSK